MPGGEPDAPHSSRICSTRPRRDGYAAAWLEDGLLAEVVDQRDVQAATAFDAVAANVGALAAQGVAERDVVRYSTDFRRIRDRRATFAGQAPLALLPFAPELTTDLCLGGMDLLMTLNCRALERRFAQANISARVAQGEEAAGCSCNVSGAGAPSMCRRQRASRCSSRV